MTKFFDAFISYGRADSKEFATKLQARLNEQGFRIWFDFNDIPLAVDYQNQIDDGIEKACHFLYLISPHSVNSLYCAKEVELAIKRNKRIIPLLHVMQISQSTWQQRNPTGTAQDWEVYKLKGKHDSYQNMHPTIQKLNWVYFQEDKDDFEKSFASLINLLRSHTDYVEQHTRFLVKALEWETNQKQTRYLLTGSEKQQAEAWLKIRFKDEQPPCVPTDLHCEYITESIKNANNLMTQVFLSYADQDRAIMEKIRHSLRRNNITVWTNTTDIQTGEVFESAIKRGIEQADNVVYLLSPDSLKSSYCQLELDLSLSLNKRIIPLLVRETDSMQAPNALRDLQYIDFTDNVKEEDYFLDQSQLLKILYEDAAYYNEHKILLTKALNWERQHYNPSILLRGYNLRSAEAWLKVAQKRTQHPPIQLQEKFINESLQQPPLESLDVFISYSRADSDLARKLNDSLQMQGKTTWFDQESIASGSDFQQEINRGIKTCDNFLFILSPRSVNSPYCKDEVGYASSLNKRFVTVLHQEINPGDLHPELAKVQWIDFNHNSRDFNANFNQLVRTIDTDREHVQSHSKWLLLALEWEQKHKSDDLLLRGSEFLIAQKWFIETQQQNKKPAATLLQKEFIEASKNAIEAAEKEEKRRQAEMLHLQSEKRKEAEARLAEQKKNAKRQKFLLVTISMAFVAAVILGMRAFEAQKKAQEAQANQLDSLSQSSLLLGQQSLKLDALLVAIRAGTQMQQLGSEVKPKTRSLILTALQAAVYGNGFRKQNDFKHTSEVLDVSFNAKDKTIATASEDGTIKLWSLNGQEIPTPTIKLGNNGTNFTFSPDGNTIVSSGEGKPFKLWSKEGKLIQTLTSDKEASFKGVVCSPDGNTIAAYNDKTIKLWSKEGQLLLTLISNTDSSIKSVTFSRDGKTIAVVSSDQTIKLWRLNGQQFKPLDSFNYPYSTNNDNLNLSPDGNTIVFSDYDTLKLWSQKEKLLKPLIGHKNSVNSIVWSPDGNTIASASNDRTVILWNKQGKLFKTLTGHKDYINSVVWSPDGNTIASASADKTVILWDKQGNLLQTLTGHKNSIKSVKFSSDSKTIATTSENDNTVIVWSKSGKKLQTLKQDKPPVLSVAWSPDGNTIAFVTESKIGASGDTTVKLWNKKDQLLKPLKKDESGVLSVAWSPDGNTIVSGSTNGAVKLWDKNGQLLKILQKDGAVVSSVAWSPDGNTIASVSGNTVQLWSKEGQLLKNLKKHESGVESIAWSPDGNTIVSGSTNGTVKLWDKNGQLLADLKGHRDAVDVVVWSPDGNTIASGSKDGSVKLWSKNGQLLADLKGYNPKDSINLNLDSVKKGDYDSESPTVKLFPRVIFSPDGKMLAYVSDDNTVKLWSKEDNFQTFKTLKGHKDEVYSVTFSPDGNTIASASKDNTVKLWNKEGMPLQTLLGHNYEVTRVSFSPDGKTLASISSDKTVMWNLADLQVDKLIKDACTQVQGYLKYNASDEDRDLCKNIDNKK